MCTVEVHVEGWLWTVRQSPQREHDIYRYEPPRGMNSQASGYLPELDNR